MTGRAIPAACTVMLAAILAAAPCGAKTATNVDSEGVAIKGYDPGAYFTLGRAVAGSGEFAFMWNEATWWFSSESHLELFAADPENYAPQYGGY